MTINTDVVVIGSGIGGLCCASLLAKYGFEVIVCESHSIAGGAAHSFERQGFKFDSGPSLYSGMSYSPSANPLKQVLDAIGEELPCVTYDAWGCYLPEGYFKASVGAEPFYDVLKEIRGEKAVSEWRRLQEVMKPLGKAAIALPANALRSDWQIIQTIIPFLPKLIPHALNTFKLTRPFSEVTDGVITDEFCRNWLDLLCFLLSGLPANGTIAAEVAFMFADWYRPGVVLDYPLGGGGALVDALVRGLTKFGGKLRLSAHVDEIIVDRDRATGVRLRGGESIWARQAVICNASVWDTLKIISETNSSSQFTQSRENIPQCDSFMHLHLGIDATDLPSDLLCHYIVVNDWKLGVTAPQNVVAVSIPSLLDPSLAPPGKHAIHVYTPANEPYSLWEGLERRSPEYAKLKSDRAEVMWQALERIIPDIKSRCEVELVGTPLTHARFLRRDRGTYGPAIAAGKGVFPGAKTPIQGLLCCGDSTFPGIGLPAVAASGAIAAHSLASSQQQLKMLREIGAM